MSHRRGAGPPLTRQLLATALLAILLLAGACSGDDGAAPGPGDLDTPPVDGATVALVDLAYEPAEVEVSAGEAVVFTNEGDIAHTVTGDELEFDSGEQLPGESFRFLTDDATPGEITFHCELHPDEMRGRIVIDSAGDGEP